MDHYTLIITNEQRTLIADALYAYSRLHLGQTGREQETAKVLVEQLKVAKATSFGSPVQDLRQ